MLAKQILTNALTTIFSEMDLTWPEKLVIEEPKDPRHGDLSINAAMLLAKKAGKQPRELATEIAARLLQLCPMLARTEVAGPGFCNVVFKPSFWQTVIPAIERAGDSWGDSNSGGGRKVLVEYVSANPTGPLHVGHGRGAAIGDSVTRLLRAAGYDASTEYYLNDAGRQMRILGLAIWLRVQRLAGNDVEFPDDCYQGGYIKDLARELLASNPDLAAMPEEKGLEICRQYGMERILEGIKKDLADFRCEHQLYFSEKSLVEDGSVPRAFAALKEKGNLYEADGATWFASRKFGDDQDRVLRKSDGSLTYFATDIAYHCNKFDRGHEWLVDVWGADHHGYIPRMKGAIEAMGKDPKSLDVLLVQLVSLTRKGEAIAMSTRAGKYELLSDVLREVGVDAARFMFLSRSSDSPLDFDLDLARSRSMDNPVYYVQYAHARICALLRRAVERGLQIPEISDPACLESLGTDEDLAILRKLSLFGDMVAAAAKNLAPQYVTAYLQDLATKLHSYYGKYPILGDDAKTALARLAMLRAAAVVLRKGLFLVGVEAPESM